LISLKQKLEKIKNFLRHAFGINKALGIFFFFFSSSFFSPEILGESGAVSSCRIFGCSVKKNF